jgi:predicted RNA-binding protein with EMAP domain
MELLIERSKTLSIGVQAKPELRRSNSLNSDTKKIIFDKDIVVSLNDRKRVVANLKEIQKIEQKTKPYKEFYLKHLDKVDYIKDFDKLNKPGKINLKGCSKTENEKWNNCRIFFCKAYLLRVLYQKKSMIL